MPRGWEDAFDGLGGPIAVAEESEGRRGWLRRLRENLGRTSRAMAQGLSEIAFDPQDADTWERLEEALIRSDVGVRATAEMVQRLEAEAAAGRLGGHDELVAELQRIVADLMAPDPDRLRIDVRARPTVILVVGVNGTGKTTTIGKLANRSTRRGRASSSPRPTRSAPRPSSSSRPGRKRRRGLRGQPERGADPAAVAFDAARPPRPRARCRARRHRGSSAHQEHLMEELAKVRASSRAPARGAPRGDARARRDDGAERTRAGQPFAQVARSRARADEAGRHAKGGVAIAIAHELGLPIKLIGIGEGLDDLRPFDAGDFARALFTSREE